MTGPCWIQQNENGSFEVPLEEPLTISAIGSPGQSFYTYQFPLEMPLLIKLKVWAGMLVKHKKRTWTPQEYNNTSPFCGILWNSALSSCKNCLGAWFCSRNFQGANLQDQSLRPENLSAKKGPPLCSLSAGISATLIFGAKGTSRTPSMASKKRIS